MPNPAKHQHAILNDSLEITIADIKKPNPIMYNTASIILYSHSLPHSILLFRLLLRIILLYLPDELLLLERILEPLLAFYNI